MEIWITVIGIILVFLIISFISLKIDAWLTNTDIMDNSIKENNNIIANMIEDVSLEEIKFVIDKDTVDNINNLLNKLISDAADTYRILVVDNDSETLSDKEVRAITSYIKYKVSHSMTPTILATLSLIYDVSDMDKISALLDEKIKIYMVGMIVNRNKQVNTR